ncbi:MAG: adenylate/guanylate cyclase domain-containing protein [Oceanococcus sp.]
MKTSSPSEFATTLWGLRFAAKDTERHYRVWHREAALPLQRFGFIAATSSWIVAFVVMNFWAPDWASQVNSLMTAIVTIYVSVTAATFTRTAVRWTLWAVVLAQIAAGLTLVLMFVNLGGYIGPALLAACYVAMYPPFMRLPPEVVILAVAPYIGLMLWVVVNAFVTGGIDGVEMMIYVVTPVLTLITATFVCAVIDRISRQTFIKDHIIQRQGKLIRRYVPPAVASSIDAGRESAVDTPQRRRITVLFCDVVGFTDMADRLDAESLTQVLNEYMSAMADIVEAHGGTLNEFAGDGLMALFGAPNELTPEDQVLNAVRAAQEMQALLPELNNSWRKLGIGEPLQIRVGINTGVLSVGSFGSEGRMTYTAIGLQTNIASRIESKAKPGEILISDGSYQLISGQIDCEPRGEIECKGVHFPVKVYAPNSE